VGDASGPAECEEVLRTWRSGNRVRDEHYGGQRDRAYGVRVGERWWAWDEHAGACSNEGDPSMGSGIGNELSVMLNPSPLLGALRFRVLGRSAQAGRPTIRAEAVPRLSDPHGGPRWLELDELGSGAERYTFDVDAERGVLLGVLALRDGQPFNQITALEISFDESIPEERFVFHPPAGEEVRPVGEHPQPQHIQPTEAQQRAPFTVLMPDRVPVDWQPSCVFIEASERPLSPAMVMLEYRSESGHESVHIAQGGAERHSVYDELAQGSGWDTVTRDGTTIRVTKPGHQVQAHLELDGTFVFLMSETLTAEQLISLASSLVPAPNPTSI
jgi:hypothetical protein